MSERVDHPPRVREAIDELMCKKDATDNRTSEYIVCMPKDMPYEIKAELNAWYVNSEPIVRCRDCKHMHTVRHWLGMDVDECWLHADSESGALGKERTEPDGFCAWGEKAVG